MAVSKTQNERPAIIELIDASNTLEEGIATLGTNLSNEIQTRTEENQALSNLIAAETTARENADYALESAIENEADARADADADLTSAISSEAATRAAEISGVETLIGDNFNNNYSISDFADGVALDIDNLLLFEETIQGALKFGAGTLASVQGNNYYDGTISYPTPYPINSVSFVFPAFVSLFDATDLEVKITNCNNAGFSYTVINRAATEKNFVIGYLALGQSTD